MTSITVKGINFDGNDGDNIDNEDDQDDEDDDDEEYYYRSATIVQQSEQCTNFAQKNAEVIK